MFRLNNSTTSISSVGIAEVNLQNSAGTYARVETESGEIPDYGSDPSLNLTFHNNGAGSARGWLDYLRIHARVRSKYQNGDFVLFDYKSVGVGNITRFTIETSQTPLMVWDITDSNNPIDIPVLYAAGEASFTVPTDSLRRFIVFRLQDAISIDHNKGLIQNQNLHSARDYDMIIVTHPLFSQSANELASIHSDLNQYNTLVVTPEEIYNEFSGGVPDISAIRNFIRMVWIRGDSGERSLKNLLLFGDGSYENRKPPPGNPNFIPTYQTQNSHINILSFTSDDYYGLLDTGEGETAGYIDIGIGRLPISTQTEAEAMIMKIRRYTSGEAMGPWRDIISMVADDEDNNLHMADAESLSDLLKSNSPEFNIKKIYFDSYNQVSSINGESYPDATRSINERIADGCLIFNYLGHGNELGLAHERVLKIEDINSWTNRYKMPLFITATCEFSRFDDIDIDEVTGNITRKLSAGEMVLLNPNGGGIALLTTTRIVYSAPNFTLNNRIYQYAFTKDENGEGLTLGQIMRLAKNNAGSGDNKRNFTLLGDPALKLSYPWKGKVVADSINGVELALLTDTIKALSKVRVSGHIEDYASNLNTNFSGIVNVTMYDKEYNVTTLANDGGSSFEFDLQDRILFKGKASVDKGLFTITFLVPRDIDYSYGSGKISMYASALNQDSHGVVNTIKVGGFSNTVAYDTSGPVIRLFMNDTLFRDGGITDTNPTLLALISDPSGINTTGTGIGHDLITYIDDKRSETVILNNYFENDLGSYTKGSLRFNLYGLKRGDHKILVKAWDNFNNSNSEVLQFLVETDKGLLLNNLINYPNPFTESTSFVLEHNRPGLRVDITIDIFGSDGRFIKKIISDQETTGYRLEPILWDGVDNRGNRITRGIYIYKVTIKTEGGESSSQSGRMVIL
jgi:hypothetical protein